MTTHAKLSPSARYRWSVCPGSVRMTANLPESESSPSALDGTKTHALLETCIKRGLTDPIIGDVITFEVEKDVFDTFVVDEERAERVRVALDYIRGRVAKNPAIQVITEERVDPAPLIGRDDMSGTADVQLVESDMVEVIDYKDGFNNVKAEGNAQLEQYSVGIAAKYIAQNRHFDKFKLTIIQPKVREQGRQPITSCVITMQDVWNIADRLRAEGAAADDPEAPCVPGEAQCKYCRAKGKTCNAMVEASFNALGGDVTGIIDNPESGDVVAMSNERIRDILLAAPLVRQMLESAEKEALHRFESGNPIDGLKVVNGRGSRKWSAPDEVVVAKLRSMRVPVSMVWKQTLITPAQVEKAKWETKNGPEQLTDRQLKNLFGELVVELTGKLTVVPEADSRKAVSFAVEQFNALPSETLPSWLA